MEANLDGLSSQLAALTQRFADLGAKLAEAAKELQVAGAPPSDALVEELATARGQFTDLRTDVLGVAEDASVPVPQAVESLASLEPLLKAVEAAVVVAARRAALEEARRGVLAVLDRVLEIAHRDDPTFAALVGCHAKAEQLRAAVEGLNDPEPQRVQELTASVTAFSDLLTMIEQRDALDDERYAQLEESVSSAFGRALAVAVARGRLVIGGIVEEEAPPPPVQAPAPVQAPVLQPPPPPEREMEPAPALEMETAEPITADAPLELEVEPSARLRLADIEEPAPPVPEPEMQPLTMAPPDAPPLRMAEPEPAPAPLTMAEPEPAPEPSAPDETAQWWLAAWARWSGWKSSMGFAEAVREELSKYPYLLAVPIQQSPEYEDGLAAYGYSIVMEHVEQQSPGCVGNALNSLKQAHGRPVGEQLYEYLVTVGKLGETYPDFVRSVMLAALPEPGLWFQSRLLDSKDDTRVFQRPTPRLGETEQTGKRLAADAQRFAEHKFSTTLAPLTAQFFVMMADHKDSRGLGMKLTADGVPSTAAWLVTIPQTGKATAKVEARRVAEDGTALPAFGRDYAALWIGVFNTESDRECRYELAVTLRKDTKSPFGPKKP